MRVSSRRSVIRTAVIAILSLPLFQGQCVDGLQSGLTAGALDAVNAALIDAVRTDLGLNSSSNVAP